MPVTSESGSVVHETFGTTVSTVIASAAEVVLRVVA